MCIGVPMRIVESDGAYAWCEGRNGRQKINMMLTGPQAAGSWVLTFLDSAREVLTAESAALINDALDALEAALRGDHNMDGHFADLVNREPELPDFLKGSQSHE